MVSYLPPFSLKGGSWISTGDEASRFARFSFRRHFFQHLGFRLVRSSKDTPVRLCKAEVFIPGAGVVGKRSGWASACVRACGGFNVFSFYRQSSDCSSNESSTISGRIDQHSISVRNAREADWAAGKGIWSGTAITIGWGRV